MHWRYGITTIPSRINTLLPDTLLSLKRAGFIQPVIVMDGLAEWASTYETVMHNNIGQLRNYVCTLTYLYTTDPKADRYAIFEDDCLACSNLRGYLDRCPFPEKGYLNLLTHEQNLVNCGPNPGWYPSNQMGRGAVGLVFDNETVATLLKNDDFMLSYYTRSGIWGIDGVLITILKELGYTEYIHNPSLLQHTGEISSLGHRFSSVSSFPGEDYNPLQLLEKPCPAQ